MRRNVTQVRPDPPNLADPALGCIAKSDDLSQNIGGEYLHRVKVIEGVLL